MSKQFRIVGLAAILLVVLSTVLLAQSGGGITLSPNTMGGGGTTNSGGGSTSAGGTMGQFVSGQSGGGNTQVNAGFWQQVSSGPLAVTLGSFSAESEGESVHFAWQTLTETGVAGFNLVGITDEGEYIINAELISSPVIDSVTRTDYSYHGVTGSTSFYLDEVNINGEVIRYGPFEIAATDGGEAPSIETNIVPSVYLPLITSE